MTERFLHLPFDLLISTSLSSLHIILLVLLVLGCLFISWMAFRRLFSHSPLRFVAVLFANIFSMLMIAALILPIGQFNAKSTHVVLFTEGAELTHYNISADRKGQEGQEGQTPSNNHIPNLSKNLNKNPNQELSQNPSQDLNQKNTSSQVHIDDDARFYQFQRSVKANDLSSQYEVTTLNHLAELMLLEPHLSRLTVVGHGLSEQQWQQLIDLNHHSDIQLSFIASDKLTGFVDVKFPKAVTLGEVVTVQATLQRFEHLKELSKFRIKLLDVNQQVLSDVVINAKAMEKENPQIEFSFVPKTHGQHLYTLQLLDEAAIATTHADDNQSPAILIEEVIAIHVAAAKMPRILIAQSSPKYETRHLKNWASEAGAEIEVVSQISKISFLIQKINSGDESKNSSDKTSANNNLAKKQSNINDLASVFSQEYLTRFDMIIIDGRLITRLAKVDLEADVTLSSSSNPLHANANANANANIAQSTSTEMTALQQAVNNGTGLLVLSDQEFIQYLNHPEHAALFSLESEAKSVQDFVDQALANHDESTSHEQNSPIEIQAVWPKGKIEQGVWVNQNHLIYNYGNSLVSSQQGAPLVVAKHFGLGKVGISAISQSFQWKTSGLSEQYSQYWHYLLQSLARNAQSFFWLKASDNELLFVNEDHQACLLADQQAMQDILVSKTMIKKTNIKKTKSSTMPLAANLQLLNSSKYCLDFWQENSGWIKFTAKGMNHQSEKTKEHWLYVNSSTAWQAQDQANKHKTSQLAVEQFQFKQNLSQNKNVERIVQEISKLPIFLCLLLINSFLWLERKFSSK